ncbi:hypothetical protein DPMN_167578 [Dreissena polymorpha]|uniref:Uncharacterized protein n=1 Tax=Dreissena polymorpha TaxID=45954 RepID=A0A9D4EZ37_DREPO|nr:hypothetical protein DPMN_167578 [Dreissena polymorpha]
MSIRMAYVHSFQRSIETRGRERPKVAHMRFKGTDLFCAAQDVIRTTCSYQRPLLVNTLAAMFSNRPEPFSYTSKII